MTLRRIKIEEIDIYAGTQTRVSTNDEAVAGYAEAMKLGSEFPPILLFFDGAKHYLSDGFHRFLAAKRNGDSDIRAEIREGSRSDALVSALGANATNGLYRTNADKRHAVEIALEEWPDRSNAYIAEVCAVSIELVRRVRKALGLDTDGIVVGKDGKQYPSGVERQARGAGSKLADGIAEGGSEGSGGGGSAPSKKNANVTDAAGGTRNELEADARQMIRAGEMDPRELDSLPTATPQDYAIAAIGILERMRRDDPKYPDAIARVERWLADRKAGLAAAAG